MKINDLVADINSYVAMSPKAICSLIAVPESSLSTGLAKTSIADGRTKLTIRLLILLFVIKELKRDTALSEIDIIRALITPAYHRRQDDTYISVAAAICQGETNKEHLMDIADASAQRPEVRTSVASH
jgi:hypothetical protein